jgi:hypothetical protein
MAGAFLKLGAKTARTTAKKAGSKKAADEAVSKQRRKELTDLGTPSSAAGTKDPNMGEYAKKELPEYKKTAYSMEQKGKALGKKEGALQKKEKQLQSMRDKADNMSGRDRIKYLAENKNKMDKIKEEMTLLRSAIKDMKRRDIVAKKEGGLLDPYAALERGNRMSKMEAGATKAMQKKNKLKSVPANNKGLKKLPSKVRNKMGYKKAGGSMKKKGYKAGGSISKPRGVGVALRGYGKAMKG